MSTLIVAPLHCGAHQRLVGPTATGLYLVEEIHGRAAYCWHHPAQCPENLLGRGHRT
jgi:hypothetical protein